VAWLVLSSAFLAPAVAAAARRRARRPPRRRRRPRLPVAAVAALAAFVISSCGGGSPSGSTPATTTAPQPTPTPPLCGNPSAASCPLGDGSPSADCGKASSRLVDAVVNALDQLVKQKPEIFDKTEEAGVGTGQYQVLDKEAYLNGLIANLSAEGYCAQRDPDDYTYERIQVKNENGFSETFDVLTGGGFMRRAGSYLETCAPAAFPVDRGDLPPAGSGCGAPYPPPISRMSCKLHFEGGEYATLDSTAIVGHDLAYCATVGFTDGRSLCPVRPETSPERVPCETWRVGYAQDTGRPGPTWTVGGKFCTGKGSGCENHPTNQHQLLVYASGSYQVCAQTGSCCTVEVER
jgi:hypothetical protein